MSTGPAPPPAAPAQPTRRGSALVTGASGGIGRELALTLAAEGYDLTLAGRDGAKLASVVEAARALGVTARPHAGDVLDDDDLAALVAGHGAEFGSIEVLVSSAGGGILGRLDDQPVTRIDRQLRLNLRAPIVLTRLALPLLREAARSGRALVVHVGSYAGKAGREDLTVYSAAKHGIVGFAAACNRELSTEGIVSVALCPTLVATPLTAPFEDRVLPETMIAPSDLAEALRFLLRTSPACVVPEIPFLRRGADPFG